MKRNKDLIREILMYVEKHDNLSVMSFKGKYDDDCGVEFIGFKTGDVSGHFKILIDAGYIDGNYQYLENGWLDDVRYKGLTMKGHDLLDGIRDTGVWAEIKKEFGVAGESWNLELMAKLGTKIISKKLGI